MGMGKTVETLALISYSKHQLQTDSHTAPGHERRSGTFGKHVSFKASTLIVCPMVLLSQWCDEVKTHTKLTVFVYYGAEKSRCSAADLLAHDVVVTSYGTLSAERASENKDGLLLSITWFRVVLDEVQSVCFVILSLAYYDFYYY
jgi:SNF2 family DNA or RNA helicase